MTWKTFFRFPGGVLRNFLLFHLDSRCFSCDFSDVKSSFREAPDSIFGSFSLSQVGCIAGAEALGTMLLLFFGCMGGAPGLGISHLQACLTFGFVVGAIIQVSFFSLGILILIKTFNKEKRKENFNLNKKQVKMIIKEKKISE